jgi:hypothetical protein
MRFTEEDYNKMFEITGIKKEDLYQALIHMGNPYEDRDEWSEQNPTRYNCYLVTEFIHYFILPKSKPMGLKTAFDKNDHKFLELDNGQIIDLTAEQFGDWGYLDYSKRKYSPLQRGKWTIGASKKAIKLAGLLGYTQQIKRNEIIEHNFFKI